MSVHHFDLLKSSQFQERSGGIRIDANQHNFLALKEMALSYLEIHPQAFREPHWHPNAHELSYCLEGHGVMTVFGPGADHSTFTIQEGDIVFIPMGSLHHIANTGDTALKMLVCFNHETPEDLELSRSVQSMPNHVLAATVNETSSFFEHLKSKSQANFIIQAKALAYHLPLTTSSYKYSLDEHTSNVESNGGSVKMSNQFVFKALEQLAIYDLYFNEKGIREPHWHPNAHELNYVISGNVRLTLLIPDGTVETFDLSPGQISFLPRGYLHYIENIGDSKAQMAVFFNHSSPSDIGISGCLGAYPNALLADLFQTSLDTFNTLEKFQEDRLIVGGG